MGEPAKEVAPDLLINDEQRLYVLPTGRNKDGKPTGYSCLGFDVCRERSEKYAEWLRHRCVVTSGMYTTASAPIPEPGTEEAYRRYLHLLKLVQLVSRESGTRCDVELTPQLIGLEGKRVEVVDKYGETRRFIVGKSTGFIPIHLEISRRDSTGGTAVTGAPFQSVRVLYDAR